ncbi:9fcf7202-8643-4bea-a82e-27de3b5664ec [Sclerotinia trifoliorum]|uniref:9fcf7202-8643-4bea-a82e-27de3b5664ec n=1 Tax=Sclerotinia trifoliorum TaxID=28548 RepID=A0A8H2ZN36_9HELO|nr:9fcf7202-8643-4bea-a82e-27de3b5664ec [Sclerotinia trifoliorum]
MAPDHVDIVSRDFGFDILPDEIVQQILYYSSPHDTLSNIQLLSKRFNRLGNEPLLWRHHCRVHFKYWDATHSFLQKLAGIVGDVDWKSLYMHRRNVDLKTTQALNRLLESRANRIVNFEEIGGFGYDAKDTLLRHCRSRGNDHLARKHYACAVLDFIHRSKALAVWSKLAAGEEVPIEAALGAHDMFILHDNVGDLQEISDILDDLATRIRADYPKFDYMSTRQQALAVVKFLRARNLLGLNSELNYRDLQNNYIGLALQEPEHPSLPLVSVAIFCAVARRIGLDAKVCGMPSHVYAMVFPKPFIDLDDKPVKQKDSAVEPMYLDPYRSTSEIPVENLLRMWTAWGVRGVSFAEFVADSSATSNIVLRTTRNIVTTIREYPYTQNRPAQDPSFVTTRLQSVPLVEMDHAIYSVTWASFLLTPTPAPPSHDQHQLVPMLMSKFEKSFPEDVALIERYILSSYNSSTTEHSELAEELRVIRAVDSTPRQVRTRSKSNGTDRVKFRIGQVFRHQRYGYTAAIIGWDVGCHMGSNWIAQHQIDFYPGGRNQSFYHVLVEDASIRYVAEDNIDIVEQPDVTSLMIVAGQYFKRYDQENGQFIANFRDEYPDD